MCFFILYVLWFCYDIFVCYFYYGFINIFYGFNKIIILRVLVFYNEKKFINFKFLFFELYKLYMYMY